VFCMSLMGDYIADAKRCLCVKGSMLIAQTTRELTDGQRMSELRDVIKEQGYVIDLNEAHGDFTFTEAIKL
jgi:hypothetical protein